MQTLFNTTASRRRGFSLAEMMVVIVIIGLLATLVVPNVIRYLGDANKLKVKSDLNAIYDTIQTYKIMNKGKAPETLDELINPPDGGESYFKGNSIPLDPWDNPYQYDSSGGEIELYSLGADMVQGGEDEDADISYQDILGE